MRDKKYTGKGAPCLEYFKELEENDKYFQRQFCQAVLYQIGKAGLSLLRGILYLDILIALTRLQVMGFPKHDMVLEKMGGKHAFWSRGCLVVRTMDHFFRADEDRVKDPQIGQGIEKKAHQYCGRALSKEFCDVARLTVSCWLGTAVGVLVGHRTD